MTNREALARLVAIHGFLMLPPARDGKPYGAGFFANRDWFGALERENRRVSMRLVRYGRCLFCDEPVSDESTGDHIIPKSRGGVTGLQNYLPLCRSHNSSKGDNDLLIWWFSKGKTMSSLHPDAVIAYARLTFQHSVEGWASKPAEEHLVTALEQFGILLPSNNHRDAVARIAP